MLIGFFNCPNGFYSCRVSVSARKTQVVDEVSAAGASNFIAWPDGMLCLQKSFVPLGFPSFIAIAIAI